MILTRKLKKTALYFLCALSIILLKSPNTMAWHKEHVRLFNYSNKKIWVFLSGHKVCVGYFNYIKSVPPASSTGVPSHVDLYVSFRNNDHLSIRNGYTCLGSQKYINWVIQAKYNNVFTTIAYLKYTSQLKAHGKVTFTRKIDVDLRKNPFSFNVTAPNEGKCDLPSNGAKLCVKLTS